MSVHFCLVFRFSRNGVQTTLPLNRQDRPARLCANYDVQINNFNREASGAQEEAQRCRRRKRDEEDKLQDLNEELQSVKVINVFFSSSLHVYAFQTHTCPLMSAGDNALL